MRNKDKHFINCKWVDCKSAIPVNQMKLIELKVKQSQELANQEVNETIKNSADPLK